METGSHLGIRWRDYYALEAVNASLLRLVRRSLLHAKHERYHPAAPTKEQELGEAFHTLILEPAAYGARYCFPKKVDRRTKAGKAYWAEFEALNVGKIPISANDRDVLEQMRDAVMLDPVASMLLKGGKASEVTMVWDRDDQKCKSRVDLISEYEGKTVLVDLKSAADASPQGFAAACARYDYHIQSAWYSDGARQLYGSHRDFWFVVVEKTPPYAVGVYRLDDNAMEQGALEAEAAFKAWVQAQESGVYPGYTPDVATISLPKWRWADLEALEDEVADG